MTMKQSLAVLIAPLAMLSGLAQPIEDLFQ